MHRIFSSGIFLILLKYERKQFGAQLVCLSNEAQNILIYELVYSNVESQMNFKL